MADLTKQLKQFALKQGADLVGITSVENLKGIPIDENVIEILADAKNVVVLAMHLDEEIADNSPMPIYSFEYYDLYDKLKDLGVAVAGFLEKAGYKTVRNSTIGKPGSFLHKPAAQMAGLGQIGLNTLLITPEYGNRVQLVTIVTNAPLAADEPYQGQLCRKCRKCLNVCPKNAITEGKVDQTICIPYLFKKKEDGGFGVLCRECRIVCQAHK